MTGIDAHALERWMYRKDGMDYGPFSVQDLHDLICAHRIDEATEVRNLRERRFVRLGDVPHLKAFYGEFTRKEAEEKRRREVLREAESLEKSIRRHHRMPILLGVGGAVALGVGVFLALRPAEPLPPGLDLDLFRPLVLGPLPAVPRVAVAPDTAPADTNGRRARKAARAQPRPGPSLGPPPPLPTVDLAFDEEDVSGGRALTKEDLSSIQKRVSSGLVRCFREEASGRPEFRGGTVSLYILGSGRVALARLDTSPPASTGLSSCALAVVKDVRVPPFAGGAQVMEIPFYVTAVR